MKKTSVSTLALTFVLAFAGGAQAALVDNGFEGYHVADGAYRIVSDDAVAGWSSTTGEIEIWGKEHRGVASYEGDQHAELNANVPGALYQEVAGIGAGALLGWEFAHRGRVGEDTVALELTDLGADGVFGTGDDTRLFSTLVTTGTDWVFYQSSRPVAALGNTIRFSLSAVASFKDNPSVGNFIDVPDFGLGVGGANISASTVPLPPAGLALILGLGGLGLTRRTKA